MRRALLAAVAVTVLVAFAGCAGPVVEGRIHNATGEARHVAVLVFPDGSTEAVFRHAGYVAASSSVSLGKVAAEPGAYDVLVTLDNGTHADGQFDLAGNGGARLTVWLRADGLSIGAS